MIKKHAPRVETDTEAVNSRLLECVLAEEIEELKDREVWVVFDTFEVRGHEPVEKVTTLGQEPVGKTLYQLLLIATEPYED